MNYMMFSEFYFEVQCVFRKNCGQAALFMPTCEKIIYF